MENAEQDLTLLLKAAEAGDARAQEDVFPLVYEQLRRLAAARLSRLPPGQTLQATALVHEAYVRLFGSGPWEGREQFFAAAARSMRNILVDQARRKASQKRGGDRERVALELASPTDAPAGDLLELDEAITRLEQADPEGARIIMLRFFAGLTQEQIAEVLGVSLRTIERKWRFLRASLHEMLRGDVP